MPCAASAPTGRAEHKRGSSLQERANPQTDSNTDAERISKIDRRDRGEDKRRTEICRNRRKPGSKALSGRPPQPGSQRPCGHRGSPALPLMPYTAISERPCSAGRKANPSCHQPGILCHPCQQGCRETEHPQAHSLLPPRTGSKAHRQRGAQGEQWDRESGDSKGRSNALTAKPTGATKTPGPFSAIREFGILGHRACGSTCNARILPQKAPEKDRRDGTGCTVFVLCTLPPHPCQRTASHGTVSAWRTALRQRGGAQDPGSCGVLFQRKA